jgi:hypothetical protein
VTARIEWWAPDRLVWWVGVLFIIGSTCFALGSFPPYAAWAGATTDGITYFIGSLFFTSAAFLQLRLGGSRLVWWAGVIQFAGTLLFNRSTFQALNQNLSAAEADTNVWRPDALGSIAFLVSSALACVDAGRARVARDSEWWSAWLNMAGSIAFGVSAAASYVITDSGELRNAERANLGTFVGAVCFLAGAVLILPREDVAAPARQQR